MNGTIGKIELGNGFSFIWAKMKDGEVCGHIEKPDMTVLKGSYGFWRTTDPEAAAYFAVQVFKNALPIPEAACPRCGGWTSYGGCSQFHDEHNKPHAGRTGCICH